LTWVEIAQISKEVAKGLVMDQSKGTPMAFGDFGREHGMPPLDAAEELDWLMSLALDEALDEGEAERLEMLLRQEPAHFERWAAWQALDSDFHQMPSVLPAADFGAKFELRLELMERRRRLRTGIIFGLAAIALWGSALTGTVMLGALVWSNQGAWFTGMIHNFAYWWAALGQFGQVFVNTGESLWAAPQTRIVLLCYIAASVAILAGWTIFLRRSLQELPQEMPMVEA
jgi:anti-sigma factor RsiW